MLTVSSSYVARSYWRYDTSGNKSPSVPKAQGASGTPATGTDAVSISAEGTKLSRRIDDAAQADRPARPFAADAVESLSTAKELQQLKARDSEVRSHEQAHIAAAGRYARGTAAYIYQRGPDGKSYATGGEVPIDIGTERTPEATIAKMQIIKRAALAPANPSAADRQIAAQASAKMLQAQRQLNQETMAHGFAAPVPELQKKSVQPDGGTTGPPPAAETFDQIRALMTKAYETIDDLL